ncbi:PIN domain-containing protein [Oscillospiraceae bacterium 44-5]
MKVAFDTNVLLDLILNRPGREDALKLMSAVAEEKVTGIVSANSITDIYYITRKGIGNNKAREAITDILSMFDIARIDGDMCSIALDLPIEDYEDALLAICAALGGADYIATRDQDFLESHSPVPTRTPADLIAMIQKE